MEYVYKKQFSVLGKLGQGPAEDPWNWILPVWDSANSNFGEIEPYVKKESGILPCTWGIMSDFGETFGRWDDNGGKYLACCEIDEDVAAPSGWTKWKVPSQTYLVERCRQEEYLGVFNNIINEYIPKNHLQLVGAVHERYPEPGNPTVVELYFPIAKGSYFCQSCGMPMGTEELRGTEKNQDKSEEYCVYCYQNGEFTSNVTMEEMVETCIPFSLESGVYPDEDTARQAMKGYFPTLKRWQTAKEV